MNPVNVIKMNETTKPELITGKSYLNRPVETDTNIIKENNIRPNIETDNPVLNLDAIG